MTSEQEIRAAALEAAARFYAGLAASGNGSYRDSIIPFARTLAEFIRDGK